MNRYRAGREQIAAGATKPPYAYVVPQEQRDPVAAVELLRRLAFGGVRVSQLTDAATIDGASYPGRDVGRADRPGVRRDGARSARRPALSRLRAVSRAVRPSGRTTPPAGRCRCRWASRVVAAATPLTATRARR